MATCPDCGADIDLSRVPDAVSAEQLERLRAQLRLQAARDEGALSALDSILAEMEAARPAAPPRVGVKTATPPPAGGDPGAVISAPSPTPAPAPVPGGRFAAEQLRQPLRAIMAARAAGVQAVVEQIDRHRDKSIVVIGPIADQLRDLAVILETAIGLILEKDVTPEQAGVVTSQMRPEDRRQILGAFHRRDRPWLVVLQEMAAQLAAQDMPEPYITLGIQSGWCPEPLRDPDAAAMREALMAEVVRLGYVVESGRGTRDHQYLLTPAGEAFLRSGAG
jgi:hypothetical protein